MRQIANIVFNMFLANYISRNDTDKYSPLYEIICIAELAFLGSSIFIGLLVVGFSIRATKVHRMVKLRIVFTSCILFLRALARLIIIYHQYFGPSEYVEIPSLIAGSIAKEFFMGYVSGLEAILAFDRWVATTAWAWYEGGSLYSHLPFFAFQEVTLLIFAFPIACIVVYGYITRLESIYCYAGLYFLGSIGRLIVYRHNSRVMTEMKRGAVINKYSVARTYQIQENLSVLTSFTKLSYTRLALAIPSFTFFFIFLLIPSGIGYDGFRFSSAAMFDLWISVGGVIIFVSVPLFLEYGKHLGENRVFMLSPSHRAVLFNEKRTLGQRQTSTFAD